MSWSIIEPLSRRTRLLVLAAALLVVAFIGFFDYLAGPFFSLSIFYLVPILVVTWFLDVWPGILLSLLCTTVGVLTDMLALSPGPYPLAAYWDGVASLAVYLFVTFLVVAFRAVLEREVELARTDALTGSANSRSFAERALLEMSRAARNKQPLTIAYLDVDRFKAVNDRFGHSTGDRLLRLIASTIGQNLRAIDLVARVGGDEFVVLLPETSYTGASLVINRVQEALDSVMHKDQWPVTFSTGVITFMQMPASVDQLIHAADKVMYSAKREGRNTLRHVVSESGTLPG